MFFKPCLTIINPHKIRAIVEKNSEMVTNEIHQCCSSHDCLLDCKIAYLPLNSSTGIIGCIFGGGWMVQTGLSCCIMSLLVKV